MHRSRTLHGRVLKSRSLPGLKPGASSADRGAARSQALLEHGRAGRFAFPPPIGALLDVDLDGGIALRVHMDGSVPPDWEGGRIPVLGSGVVPDPGVLSRCPYVYRVRCESDGVRRRVWIGTQSLARPTEWVPLADCSWTDDSLITPAATEILRRRPSATSSAPTEAAPLGIFAWERHPVHPRTGGSPARRNRRTRTAPLRRQRPLLESLDAASPHRSRTGT